MKRKLLLLGGSAQQVIAIETAKRLGYDTVLCDYLADNPGQYVADKFYQVSTTDKDAVLRVAQEEGISGILAYASDPAAPTAAYVAEKMDLSTNPYRSVEILCNKDNFRAFLRGNGFNAPCSGGYASVEEALREREKYHLPVIVKPTDSSGSKGITVLHTWDGLEDAYDRALSFSRAKRIIMEEYIEKKHPYLIGGDIFIQDGKVILWGLMNCHRDDKVNPLVPVGKSYPPELAEADVSRVRDTLQGIVDRLHLHNGAMNVELVIDRDDRVWPIDIGPRNGGNRIPELMGLIFGIDVVEMSVKTAMEENVQFEISKESSSCYATCNLHSVQSGILEEVLFSKELESFIIKKYIYMKKGDFVEYFDNAAKVIGILFLKFTDKKKMQKILSNLERHIIIKLATEKMEQISSNGEE